MLGTITVLVSEKNRRVCQTYTRKYYSYRNYSCH